jgi:hypothetical protein
LCRDHWAIENKKHWALNVSFDEHIATTRKGWGAQNMGILRRVALGLLQNNSAALSINNKRARAACDENHMFEVLCGEKVDLKSHINKIFDFMSHGMNMVIDMAILAWMTFIV